MVRCQKYLEIIHKDKLVQNAEKQGKILLKGLEDIQEDHPEIISNARGRGLMCAIDLPTPDIRDELRNAIQKNGLVVLGCGTATIRFRPPLLINTDEVNQMISIFKKTVQEF